MYMKAGVVSGAIVAAVLGLADRTGAQLHSPAADTSPPITGDILPGSESLQQLDRVVRQILERHEVPGAALAITHDGKLIVARGYGWANIEAREPTRPITRFDLASVSKSITAVAVLKLVEEGRLKLDEHVFDLLGQLRAPPGERFDERLRRVTIRMLLEHSGGWDRTKPHGDPISFESRATKELRVQLPITADDLIHYVVGRPLDFDPGTQQKYSNFGYMTLGRVIEHVSGERYAEFVQRATLHPMGIEDIQMTPRQQPEREALYLRDEARRYLAGSRRPLSAGHGGPTGAAGGWCASAVAMAKFLTAVDGTRTGKRFLRAAMMQRMLARPEPPLEIRKNGSWFGLGWDSVHEMRNWPHEPAVTVGNLSDQEKQFDIDNLAYGKDGGVPGISTWIEHLPGGSDWVIFFNGSEKRHTEHPDEAERPSESPTGNALQDARKQVVDLLREVKQWPHGDLFEKYQ
jgi:CubicO group peptidase (beta-lactamase class C family)